MRLVLLGPPGAGKGTQASYLQERHGLLKLSTGDMLRSVVASDSDVGRTVNDFMRRGDLVPDEIVVQALSERLDQPDMKRGFVFDGFPRNVAQAQVLDKLLEDKALQLDAVVEMRVMDDILAERIAGRYSCAECSEGYHDVFKVPVDANMCDKCGSETFSRRSDDDVDIVKSRLGVYHRQTTPLIAYYKDRNLLRSVDGMAGIDDVAAQLDRIVECDH